jgi:ATP-dependent DNA helicase RecG
MRLDDAELERLLASGESFRVERKESLAGNAPNAIREAICAFANDLPGSEQPGVVFVGVRDDGSPKGLAITDELLRQLADMKSDGAIVPPPSLFVEKRELRGADAGVVTVVPSDSPTVRYRGAIHVRIGPRKGLATAQDERILNEKRRYRDKPFDIWPARGVDISKFRPRWFEEEYLPRAFSAEVLASNDRTQNQRLAATKMIEAVDIPVPTILGLFVLGKTPTDFVPSFCVLFLRIDGTELSDPILDAEYIKGNLSQMVEGVETRMSSHIHTKYDIISSDTEIRTPSYPLGALRELARNAIMHRSYEGTNSPTRVTWFNDRIEFMNAGGPFGLAAGADFGEPGFTDYRNPNLAEAMRVLGFVQRFGVGILNARKLLRDNGHPELEFEIDGGFTRAIVRSKDRKSAPSGPRTSNPATP